MMCPCKFISCNTHTPLVGDVARGEWLHVGGHGDMRNICTFHSVLLWNLKLLLKKKKKSLFKSLNSGLQCGDRFAAQARGIHRSLPCLFTVVREGHVGGCFPRILQVRALREPCGVLPRRNI